MSFPDNVQELIGLAETYTLDGAPFTASDRLHKAADALSLAALAAGYPLPNKYQAKLKPLDADIAHLLETLETDEEINLDFDCADGELSQDASRLAATARRLAREAGYALPETVQTSGGLDD